MTALWQACQHEVLIHSQQCIWSGWRSGSCYFFFFSTCCLNFPLKRRKKERKEVCLKTEIPYYPITLTASSKMSEKKPLSFYFFLTANMLVLRFSNKVLFFHIYAKCIIIIIITYIYNALNDALSASRIHNKLKTIPSKYIHIQNRQS